MRSFLIHVVQNLRSDVFGSNRRPFVFQEVIDQGGESIKGEDYMQTGRITNFKYGLKLAEVSTQQRRLKGAFKFIYIYICCC